MSENRVGPQFTRFLSPLVETLREMGGSGPVAEAIDRVLENVGISDEEQSITLNSGASRVRNQVQWARMYLVKGGLIDASRRGVWTLTENSLRDGLTEEQAFALYQRVSQEFRDEQKAKRRQAAASDVTEEEEAPSEETDLLATLRGLSPAGFERLCQRLLRESGFQRVTVTGRSGDGGIDGRGVLEVNPLVSFTVLFQCKRYQGSVNAGQIRDFRGAMQGRADRAIMLTTGSFTVDARREATRDGAPPIELIDGEKLVEMFQRLELGVKPRTVYDVDHRFFDEFRK